MWQGYTRIPRVYIEVKIKMRFVLTSFPSSISLPKVIRDEFIDLDQLYPIELDAEIGVDTPAEFVPFATSQ